MCRIFYNASSSITFVEEDLWGFLKALEKSQGGDGNGLYLMESNELEKSAFAMPRQRGSRRWLHLHPQLPPGPLSPRWRM